MSDKTISSTHPEEHPHENVAGAKFTCPNCGKIDRDDVIFLCNTCTQSEMIYQNGMYMCPSCLAPGNNFECMKCDSKEVEIKLKD